MVCTVHYHQCHCDFPLLVKQPFPVPRRLQEMASGLELPRIRRWPACSVGWFVSLLICKEVLLAGLCERKILFWLEIYDRLRQATAKRTG